MSPAEKALLANYIEDFLNEVESPDFWEMAPKINEWNLPDGGKLKLLHDKSKIYGFDESSTDDAGLYPLYMIFLYEKNGNTTYLKKTGYSYRPDGLDPHWEGPFRVVEPQVKITMVFE